MVTRLCTRLLRERDRLTQFSGSPGSIPIIGYGSVPWADFGAGGGPGQQMGDWPEVLNSLRLQKLSFFFEKGGLNISSS